MYNSIQQNFEFSMSFLKGYKELKIPILDRDGNSNWPELFPVSKIKEMREMVGLRHFSSQMMLEYVNEEKMRLDPGALHFYSDDFDRRAAKIGEHLITGVSIYWDPSIGRKNSDNSVCAIIYRDDKNKTAFIHDIFYMTVSDADTHPLATQCELVLDILQKYGIRKISIEVNGMGAALPEILNQAAQKHGAGIVVQKIVNHQKKEIRILDSFEPLLTSGRLYVHEKISATPFLSEMMSWVPIGGNQTDDGLDAVAGALRVTPTPVRPYGGCAKIIQANTKFTL